MKSVLKYMNWRTGLVGLAVLMGVVIVLNYSGGCPVQNEHVVVRGHSLRGLIEEGQSMTLQGGYYSCHAVQRGDIVAFRHPAYDTPIIKVARGIPGDMLSLQRADAVSWYVVVNGVLLRTTHGNFYAIDDTRAKMLGLYIRDDHGLIAEDSYLLLGEDPGGSFDSTRIGLVSKDVLLGRMVDLKK